MKKQISIQLPIREQLRELRVQVNNILDEHCSKCITYKRNKEEKGCAYSSNYCLTKCNTGQKLQKLGDEIELLTKVKRIKISV